MFYLEEYFNGECRAKGVFENRFGRVTRHFDIQVDGTWDGTQLTLAESVFFKDGATDQRLWKIKKMGSHSYEGEANGIVGKARGSVVDQTFHWRYKLHLRLGKRKFLTTFDDWMWHSNDGTVINRATISKFGVTLGRTWLFFQRGPFPGTLQHSI